MTAEYAPRGRTVRVKLHDRTFIVSFDDGDNPLNIRELKKVMRNGVELSFGEAYWNAKHHRIGGPSTITALVLKEARSKLNGS